MISEGYIERRITEEQRVRLLKVSSYIECGTNNKGMLAESYYKKCSVLFIPYKSKRWKLKDKHKTHDYFKIGMLFDNSGFYVIPTTKGENRLTLARLFSYEQPLKAYLSPKLSQALSTFLNKECDHDFK